MKDVLLIGGALKWENDNHTGGQGVSNCEINFPA